MMNTPVILIIFRRPDLTEQVLRCIERARPAKLFVVADGPREGHPEDVEQVLAARALIDTIDWPCEVYRNFSDINLGCGLRPATGISWAFEHVDRAIILEDDCVPDDSFFRFCDELLERFEDDERVMQISGNNFQFGHKRGEASYYFSRFGICWGWATWRRAWKHFDFELKGWGELRDRNWLEAHLGDAVAGEIFREIFESAHKSHGRVDYWDYQWTFACWTQNGLSISPNCTLVTNLGCRPDGTHTKSANSKIARLATEAMDFPIRHPNFVMPEYEADHVFCQNLAAGRKRKPGLSYKRVRSRVSAMLPQTLKKFLRSRSW
jgi:hypothetical protein